MNNFHGHNDLPSVSIGHNKMFEKSDVVNGLIMYNRQILVFCKTNVFVGHVNDIVSNINNGHPLDTKEICVQ